METTKKCVLEVYVKEIKLQEVQSKFDRIKSLFDVDLRVVSNQGKQFMFAPGHWMEITGSKENASKARVRNFYNEVGEFDS